MTPKQRTQGQPKPKRGKATSPYTLAVRRRQEEAVRLRSGGATFQQIADMVGYSSVATAFQAVQAVLGRAESESAEELRSLHGERLRAAFVQVGPILESVLVLPEFPGSWDAWDASARRDFLDRVEAGIRADREMRLKAVDRWVRLLEREARLHGLDAPVRSEVSGDGTVLQVVFDAGLAPKPRELP